MAALPDLDYVNFIVWGYWYDSKKKEKNMGRYLSTATGILLASTLLTMHQSIAAAEDQTIPGTTVIVTTADAPVAFGTTNGPESAEQAIFRLFGLYLEARSSGMLDEAEVLAKQIVEISINTYGVQSKRTAEALTDLGVLQASNGDYSAALLNLAQAIEIIETLEDYLSLDLMNPVRTMADVQMRAGSADLAAMNWNRALHISHVNLGPHNPDQIETLISLGRLYDSAGMTKEANRIRKRITYLESREFDGIGVALLPDN